MASETKSETPLQVAELRPTIKIAMRRWVERFRDEQNDD